jgi:hypothetical protein
MQACCSLHYNYAIKPCDSKRLESHDQAASRGKKEAAGSNPFFQLISKNGPRTYTDVATEIGPDVCMISVQCR